MEKKNNTKAHANNAVTLKELWYQCLNNWKWFVVSVVACREFNPVTYAANQPKSEGNGIRLTLGMADEVRYTYSMNLNNLTILLGDVAEQRTPSRD